MEKAFMNHEIIYEKKLAIMRRGVARSSRERVPEQVQDREVKLKIQFRKVASSEPLLYGTHTVSAAAGKFRRRHRTIPHYQLARETKRNETKRNETKRIQHRDEVLDPLRPLHSSQL